MLEWLWEWVFYPFPDLFEIDWGEEDTPADPAANP